MVFKMSPKAMLEEELMEFKSLCDGFPEEASGIIGLLHTSEERDHKNDQERLDVRRFLLSALRAYNMRDYEGMNNDVHAALQRMQQQEQTDLSDDKPRTDALIKLSIFQDKLIRYSSRSRDLLGKLNENKENDK